MNGNSKKQQTNITNILINLGINQYIRNFSLYCAYAAVCFSVCILILSCFDMKREILVLIPVTCWIYVLSAILAFVQYISAKIAVKIYQMHLKRCARSLKETLTKLETLLVLLEERKKEYEEINRKRN